MSLEQVTALVGSSNFSDGELEKVDWDDLASRTDLDWRLAERLALKRVAPGTELPGEYKHWNSREGILSVQFYEGKAVRKVWIERDTIVRRAVRRVLRLFR